MKSMRFLFLIASLILCFINGPIEAQNYSFSTPEKLDKNINSDAEESMPIISPDGQTMYFVRTFYADNIGGKLSGQDIWISNLSSTGRWEPASNNFPMLNNTRNNAIIGVNSDGSAISLINSYKPNTTRISGIARSARIGDDWSKPEDIKIPGLESNNTFIGFFVNKTEDVALISMNGENSYGEEDIYISIKDKNGNWSKPENIGASINTKGFEISPFLSDDGKTLFFASDGHNGYGGSDIYMAKRLYDSWLLWSKPVNLGKEINSKGFDAYLYLYNNQEAYFASTRENDFADIYMARVTAGETSKEKAEIQADKYKLTETEIQELLGMPVSRVINFDFGSFVVSAPSRELIYFLANKLVDNPQYNIELIGHTDQEGSEEFNMELSLKRAQEVAGYFMDFGISPARIKTKGKGKKEPLIIKGANEELAKNRRVEIFFVK